MTVLLDTHVFLWLVTNDPRLSKPARKILEDESNDLVLSAASGWEIVLKAGVGKLTLSRPADDFVDHFSTLYQLTSLPIDLRHALYTSRLPAHHRDPFDRVIAAQSLVESIPLLSADDIFRRYQVNVIW